MKIGLFNYSDNLGGAARASYRIHKSLINQGIKKAIVAVPEMSIGSSFHSTDLTSHGFFADWHMFREFIIKDEILRDANYGNIEIGNKGSKRYMAIGTRFYISPSGERVVLTASQDSDGDQRIVVTTRHEGDALQLIEEFESDFYQSGPLKGEFFDMDYNFIKRNRRW